MAQLVARYGTEEPRQSLGRENFGSLVLGAFPTLSTFEAVKI